jgi:hypothetical protein
VNKVEGMDEREPQFKSELSHLKAEIKGLLKNLKDPEKRAHSWTAVTTRYEAIAKLYPAPND